MKADIPSVSIVMPLFNKEKEVGRAIRSVLSQTVQDFELIIVNDGSTDNSPSVVNRFDDPRIRMYYQKNSGVSSARNRGISEAQAELIGFLDADDEWTLEFLETILSLKSEYPLCEVFGTRYVFSSGTGHKRPAVIRGVSPDLQHTVLTNYFIVAVQSDPPLCSSAVAVTKKAVEAVGGFPVGITAGEDLLTWARLAVKFQIAYSTKPCAIFYYPGRQSDRPGQIPQELDPVGKSLKELLDNEDSATIPGLKAYIALWHRMRAVIFIHLGERRNALKEIIMAMRFMPDLRLFMFLLIAILPGSLPSKVLLSIKRIKASS